MFRIVLFFGVPGLCEVEYYPIDTIPQPGWLWPVMKDMSEVRLAAAAFHFRPLHAMGVVRQINDAALADRLIKAWPATAAFELGIAPEKRIAAHRTIVCPDLMIIL